MELGVFAKIFASSSLSERFTIVTDMGFETVQFNMQCAGLDTMPSEIPEELIKEINVEMEFHSLSMTAISGTFNIIHPDKKRREEDFHRFEVLTKASQNLCTQTISICTGTLDPTDKWNAHPENNSPIAWEEMTKSMERILKLAEDFEINIAVEPEHSNVVNDIDKAYMLSKEMQSRRLLFILDIANLISIPNAKELKYIIDKGVDLLGEKLVMVHAKDKAADGKIMPPGKGMIPFEYLLRRLEKYGIDIPIVAHGFEEKNAEGVFQYLNNLDN